MKLLNSYKVLELPVAWYKASIVLQSGHIHVQFNSTVYLIKIPSISQQHS